jgi:hypothetical protein
MIVPILLALMLLFTVPGSSIAQDGAIRVTRTVWSVGVEEGPAEQVFGELVDAAMGPDGTVYLFDRGAQLIRVFDRSGRHVRNIGRRGRGPGEFLAPLELIHDGDSTLYALDAVNGLTEFRTARGKTEHVRTIVLPITRVSAFCLTRGQFVFLAPVGDSAILHTVARDGRLIRSWGTAFGPREYPPSGRMILTAGGRVACVPQRDEVIVTSGLTAEIRAYRHTDGALLWADSLRGFRPPAVAVTPGSRGTPAIRQSMIPGGFDTNVFLRFVRPDAVLAQASRTNRDTDHIFTRLLDVRTGKQQMRHESRDHADALKKLPVLVGTKGVILENLPFPRARLVELIVAETAHRPENATRWADRRRGREFGHCIRRTIQCRGASDGWSPG